MCQIIAPIDPRPPRQMKGDNKMTLTTCPGKNRRNGTGTIVKLSGKKSSSQYCALAAFKHCDQLHNRIMPDISALDLQQILDREDLSHSMLEHIKTLFN